MAEFELPESLRNLPKMDLTPTKVEKVESIAWDRLQHYTGHRFRLYQGEQKKDMIESIRANGIFTPMIVRPKGDVYEILAGHNRFECGKEAGLQEFPCIVRNVDAEIAQRIMLITNLHQRGFEAMAHSEKAEIIKLYYADVKAQGKRNDLIKEISGILEAAQNTDKINESTTSSLVDTKLQGKKETAQAYSLSPATISRYLRIAELCKDFLELLDEGNLGIYAGVELSYLSVEEQQMVYQYITNNGLKVDMKKAKEIRSLSRQQKLNEFSLPSVWTKKKAEQKKQGTTVKLKRKDFSIYFTEEDTEEEITAVIKAALQFYFEYSVGGEPED